MSPQRKAREGENIIATNRAAYHNYFVVETIEAGMELRGTEIKSLRDGGAQLREGCIRTNGGEAGLANVRTSPYWHGNVNKHGPRRGRKLLKHSAKRITMGRTISQKGRALGPL